MNITSHGPLILLTSILALLATGTSQTRAGHYEVKKNFELQPQATAGISVRSITYCHAFAFDKPRDAALCECSDVEPAAQPADFDPFRKSILAGYNSTVVKNQTVDANGKMKWLVANTNMTPFGALGGEESFEALADLCPSFAKSGATVKVDAFIGTNRITGTVGVTGTNFVVRYNQFHKSYAFSMAMMEVQGSNMVRGKIKPGPIFRKTAKGPGGPGGCQHQNDPVTFRVRNRLTRAVTTGSLFRFTMETLPGAFGDVFWESNTVHIGVSDLSFRLALPGPYTTETGHLQLEVRGGAVLQAEASGIYAGVLPPVGTAVPFQFALDNGQSFSYDLTSIAGTNADVALDLAAAGEVYEEYAADEPPMSLTVTPNHAFVSWPVSVAPWQLQSRSSFGTNTPWADVAARPMILDDQQIVPVPSAEPAQFFRLRREEFPCELAVTAQPVDAFAGPDTMVTWFVGVAGVPMPTQFQWQRLGEDGLFLDIQDATEPFLTWTVTPLDSGAQFRCRIDSGCATATSLPGKLILFDAAN